MITIEHTSVMNFENAIRGARNPMNSWSRIDSIYNDQGEFIMGENDLNLATRLCQAGNDHRKFIRQILVSVDFNAPLYWWKEYDTYKVGTVANSTSTMHKITSKPFEISDFSHEHMQKIAKDSLQLTIQVLESLRLAYTEKKDKSLWYSIIQLLPTSYHQLRTCTMNYETLANIYFARKDHKLQEWHEVCEWIKTLPYAKELILSCNHNV